MSAFGRRAFRMLARARLRRALRVEVVHRPIAGLPRSPVCPVTGPRSSIEVAPLPRLRRGEELVRAAIAHAPRWSGVASRSNGYSRRYWIGPCSHAGGSHSVPRAGNAHRGAPSARARAVGRAGDRKRGDGKGACDCGITRDRGQRVAMPRSRSPVTAGLLDHTATLVAACRHGRTTALPSRLRLSGAP